MLGGYPERQRNAELLYNRKKSTIMNASQVGTVHAAAYGHQMVATPGTYSSLNPGLISNPTAETTGYVSENQMYEATSNNAAQTGFYNPDCQCHCNGAYFFNPAEQQANSMANYHYYPQASSIGYQENSIAYQGNFVVYQANPAGYQGSYYHPAAVADQFAYPYNNGYYYDTPMQAYQSQQSTAGFRTQPNWHTKKMKNNTMHKKGPPKTFQVYYCEVCKIGCTSSNSYREHLESQKHKKKEILSKNEISENSTDVSNKNFLQCKLCSVSCSGIEPYNSHIRGAKHQKAILLHKKLGKEIPTEELVLGKKEEDGSETDIQAVGQDYLEEIKNEAGTMVNFKCKLCDCQVGKNSKDSHAKGRRHRLQYKKTVLGNVGKCSNGKDGTEIDIGPVGQDYLEEVKNEAGTINNYKCKLCDCQVGKNAKDLHTKGRRHRLLYKKKVDSNETNVA